MHRIGPFSGDGSTKVIMQSASIGDILFITPIVRDFDFHVIWPLKDKFMWLADYLQMDNVSFIPESAFHSNFLYSTYEKLMFVDAQNILKNEYGIETDCMGGKYAYAGVPLGKWVELKWNRNIQRENNLYELLGLKEKNSYIVVNNNFAEPGLNYSLDIKVDTDLPVINMSYMNGFTLLDWGKVIENAKEFHTVSTSTLYMVEYLNCENTECHLYPRYGLDTNLDIIRPIIESVKPRWICHE